VVAVEADSQFDSFEEKLCVGESFAIDAVVVVSEELAVADVDEELEVDSRDCSESGFD
jgi:hypothetical protein